MLALPPETPLTPKPKSNPAFKTTQCAKEPRVHATAPFLKRSFGFWLHWVFVAFEQVFSSCGERGLFCCGAQAPHGGGFS